MGQSQSEGENGRSGSLRRLAARLLMRGLKADAHLFQLSIFLVLATQSLKCSAYDRVFALMTSTNKIATSLLLFVTAMSGTFGAEVKPGPQTIPELQTAIEKILQETKTPGAAIAIVSRDKAEWVDGIGLADVAAHQPVTAETLFRIGSTSKSFVALAALQLQEEGKLKLTDTVNQWLPDVAFSNPWEATDPVRLMHLMEHTTGFDDIHLREYALDDPTPMTLKEALAFGASSRVCRWPPGARMSYCNSGPAVLAAVIEKVTGERFEDYVQAHLFNPLHMDTASYFYTPAVRAAFDKAVSCRQRHPLSLLAHCLPARRRHQRLGQGHGQLRPVLSATR